MYADETRRRRKIYYKWLIDSIRREEENENREGNIFNVVLNTTSV